MNATQLADHLGVSKARISQYVAQGLLADCFEGEGRSRRFDPDRVRLALQRRLDPGQLLGNGAKTRQVLRQAVSDPAPPAPRPPRAETVLTAADPDRYELARIQSAEEDARRKRRDNERDEGRWLLADEVQRQSARALTQEIAQFESALREMARAVADRMGLDYREVRAVMMTQWRAHRSTRAAELEQAAEGAGLTVAEIEAQG